MTKRTPTRKTRPNPLGALARHGQSPWFDNISRSLLASGALARMIEEDGLKGVTSNPTIFEKAVSSGTDYDEAIARALAGGERDTERIFELIAMRDIREAADLLLGVYEASGGQDGFVSMEVSPALAHDTEGTVRAALRLHEEIGRRNVMIKVPATKAGLPAVAGLIGRGIPVNVTLIFSRERYREVMEAYLIGLETLAASGLPLAAVASVASFFVSRIDSSVDKLLEARLAAGGSPSLRRLLGKVAVANAKAAYADFKKTFGSKRFAALAKKGTRVQRPLWASTGTKNPSYSDILYVEGLIGKDTVNTLPPATWDAFRDHGKPADTLKSDLAGARKVLRDLEAAGVDLSRVTQELEDSGVKSFADSYAALLACVAEKADRLRGSQNPRLEELKRSRFASRLPAKDAKLWKDEAAHRALISSSLGWLRMPEEMQDRVGEIMGFTQEIRDAGFTDALLLGMGGSSLAPEVFRQAFPARASSSSRALTLRVLDSTDPETLASFEAACDPAKTLHIVSSKSGTTVEPLRLFDHFYSRASRSLGGSAGKSFAAITDPGSFLERQGKERGLRRVFLNPPDIGGRYSALSLFGLVPAALAGVDIGELLRRAWAMARACAVEDPARNPALLLAAQMLALADKGRDKFSFLLPEELSNLGLWLEQLLAESLGKEGKGIVPVAEGAAPGPESCGPDRAFVHIGLDSKEDEDGDPSVAAAAKLEAAGFPVLRTSLKDPLDLGAEFFRWEVAASALGHLLGIDPFDQPDVQSAKDRTKTVLSSRSGGKLPYPPCTAAGEGFTLTLSKAGAKALRDPAADGELTLGNFTSLLRPGDYIGLLAFMDSSGKNDAPLGRIKDSLGAATKAAVQSGYGPRYLHSTGQLHKGGPDNGVFLILAKEHPGGALIPGSDYSFSELIGAQALGDFQALDGAGRRAFFVRITGKTGAVLERIRTALESSSEKVLYSTSKRA